MYDLTSIQPHKVSRDLKGYTIFVYGAPKVGKTTTEVVEKALVLSAKELFATVHNTTRHMHL